MAIQLSTLVLTFRENQTSLNYIVKVTPTTDSLKIVVEGEYELAFANQRDKIFVKELVLLADTTLPIPKIEREIVVRKQNKGGDGRILHTLSDKKEQVVLQVKAETLTPVPKTAVDTPPKSPAVPEKRIAPVFIFERNEVKFKKIKPGEIKTEVFTIGSSGIEKYVLEATSPFKISKDNKTFHQTLSFDVNPKGEQQRVYIQFQTLKVGMYKQFIFIRGQNANLRQISVRGVCREPSPLTLASIPFMGVLKGIGVLFIAIGLVYLVGFSGIFKRQKPAQANVIFSEAVLPVTYNDPSCKPSMYKKLKEKSTIIRYGCLNQDCDTAFVREVLVNASGSKAFGYVDIHQGMIKGDKCGEWISGIFQANKADILFTKETCEGLTNVDMSHHLCDNQTVKPGCAFLIPCGNSEGLLKVINKEIRSRKAKMNIFE